MIVTTIAQMQKYLPSFNLKTSKPEENRLSSFLNRGQEWVVTLILGEDIEETLEIDYTPGTTDPHEKLRTLTGMVISEQAYLMAIAELDLQLSEAGFVVQSNDKMSPASQQRVDRLVQSLTERLNSDCDSLVKYLLRHSQEDEPYDDWRDTDQFKYLTEAFLPTMEDVAKVCMRNPVQSWSDFHNLIEKLSFVLHTKVASYVSDEQIDALLEYYRADELLDEHKKVITWLRMAAVAGVTNSIGSDVATYAIQARNYMLKHESSFPAFVSSDRYTLPGISFGDGTVANAL